MKSENLEEPAYVAEEHFECNVEEMTTLASTLKGSWIERRGKLENFYELVLLTIFLGFVLGTSTFLDYSNVDVLRTNPEPATTWQTRSMYNGTPKISFELEVASITKKFISRPNTSVLLQDFQSMFH